MRKFTLFVAILSIFLLATTSFADLRILESKQDFTNTINGAKADVPVMVSFSAYWCGPCQKLKKTLTEVAPEYNDSQVMMCYVDAYVNSELKSYLKGGYPTVRVFRAGQLQDEYFVGAKSANSIRQFVTKITGNEERGGAKAGKLNILDSVVDFKNTITKSAAPVMISFSAHWCGPCQRLKKTLTQVAPEYSENEIKMCYIDAYVNSELKSYLKGGYPTVRVFRGGILQDEYFVGSKSADFIKNFANGLIAPFSVEGSGLKELETAADFQRMIAKSATPVMVSFSAHWCGPCQRLKKTLKEVSAEYNDSQIQICYVDASVNTSLKKYLKGGYPTVRVFRSGMVQDEYFIGAKSAQTVKSFINKVIGD